MRYGLIELPNVTDARGNLTVGEFGNHIPFDPPPTTRVSSRSGTNVSRAVS